MQQLTSLWSALDTRRRVLAGLATLAVFVAVLGLARMATNPGMALLYAGLDMSQAGEVVTALEQNGAVYEVRGDSIFVQADMRDELRMTLAGDGLPSDSGAGYELLDTLSGFGTTSQMFDAAYWRAKEGELARTIMASPFVRQARVHIANPGSKPFQRGLTPTASVTVTSAGRALTDGQGQALRYLVASAVAGLSPEEVSIIDAATGRIVGSSAGEAEDRAGTDRAEQLKANVERLLEARVGPGNAIVEVSVETVTERESIVERRFDPESRVAISTDTEEITSTSQNSGPDSVTVASNLPAGDAAAEGGQSQSQNSETRERTNFEVSETKREVLRAPGAIKRLTVAVLIDGTTTEGADGAEVWQPRPDEELEALRELVASAVGYDAERGDVITLKSLALEAAALPGPAPRPGLVERLGLDLMRLVQFGVLALVTLALGLFVVRPILAANRQQGQAALPVPVTAMGGEAPGFDIEGAAAEPAGAGGLPELPALGDGGGLPAMATITDFDTDGLIDAAGADAADPVGQLKSLIEVRRPDTMEILKSWLEDDTTAETT